MSMFSEYLRQLIQGRDISISKLSRDSGVERTAIHKALAGGRILPYHAVELLIYYLKLSPGESRKLYQYYNQLFESEAVSRTWDIIDKIFLSLSDLSSAMSNRLRRFRELSFNYPHSQKNTYKGMNDIFKGLQWMLEKELDFKEPRLELAAPPHVKALEKCIKNIYQDGSSIKITHIICFDASEAENEYNLQNLECLYHVLPGCILSNQQYDVYYYYSNIVQTQYTDPLPYFLVTHSGVLCFSENFQIAIFLEEREQIEYFHACFYRLKQSCHRLIEYIEKPVILGKDTVFSQLGKGCAFMMSQPYMMEVQIKKMMILFTRKGIVDFLSLESQYDFFTGSVLMADEQKRVQLLHLFLEKIKTDQIKGRLMDDMGFGFPENFVVFIFAGLGLLVCDKDGSWGIHVRESNLCKAFYDWSVRFSEGDYVLDKERTVEVLAEALRLWQKA